LDKKYFFARVDETFGEYSTDSNFVTWAWELEDENALSFNLGRIWRSADIQDRNSWEYAFEAEGGNNSPAELQAVTLEEYAVLKKYLTELRYHGLDFETLPNSAQLIRAVGKKVELRRSGLRRICFGWDLGELVVIPDDEDEGDIMTGRQWIEIDPVTLQAVDDKGEGVNLWNLSQHELMGILDASSEKQDAVGLEGAGGLGDLPATGAGRL
jgi:hypothetical protein